MIEPGSTLIASRCVARTRQHTEISKSADSELSQKMRWTLAKSHPFPRPLAVVFGRRGKQTC